MCPKWAFNSPVKAETFWFACLQIPLIYCDKCYYFWAIAWMTWDVSRFLLPFCIRFRVVRMKEVSRFPFWLGTSTPFLSYLLGWLLSGGILFHCLNSHWLRPMGCNSSIDLLVYYPFFSWNPPLANFGNFLFEVKNILLGFLFDLTEGMSTNICNFWCSYWLHFCNKECLGWPKPWICPRKFGLTSSIGWIFTNPGWS